MKTHVEIKRVEKIIVHTIAMMLLFLMAAPMIPAQAPPTPVPAPENILAGALIIPMDNANQGDGGATPFNLRAYGLANLLLQEDIPIKWAIKPGKSKDDTDFSANVTRIAGGFGVAGPANVAFAGGPFVITKEYDTPFVQNLISTFNGGGTPVTVYKTNADALVDIRYTLTHKPKIAVGPDGGNFGPGVFQGLFDRAGIPNYTVGVDNIDTAGSCFTLATQGHQEDPTFVTKYRNFVTSGGNLFLQCASVNTFENHASGHFQTTVPGYTVFTSNPPTPNEVNSNAFAFPEGYMPFNQFIGLLADQDGEVTEYAYALGATGANGNRIAATNTGAHAEKFVATVSQVNGENAVGGVVFEMGGHNYARPDDGGETDSALAMLNGQRMQLNAVFVPSGTVCTQLQEGVIGFKSVRRFNVRNGGPSQLIVGDTAVWTIDYVNNSQVNQFGFQIRDFIHEFTPNSVLQFESFDDPDTPAAEPPVQVQVYGGAVASANLNYNGVGNIDLLAPNAFLPPGGRIQVKVKTKVIGLPSEAACPTTVQRCIFNQTNAISNSQPVPIPSNRSDAIDANNAGIFSEDPPLADSYQQNQNGAIINNTVAPVVHPTAANVSVEGRVVNADGTGIRNALVTVRDAATGEFWSTRTNSFGFFRIDGLEAGNLFVVSASHKQFRFGDPVVVSLGEDMTGMTFTALANDNRAGVRMTKSR